MFYHTKFEGLASLILLKLQPPRKNANVRQVVNNTLGEKIMVLNHTNRERILPRQYIICNLKSGMK
jgi:hypothetical protein